MNWRRHWIEAQGYDFWYWQDHVQEGLFKQDCCTVCGKVWRPDYPPYISVFGKVRGLIFDDNGKLIATEKVIDWYSEQIGAYSTGHLDDHLRLVCLDHGDRWPMLIDCRTNCEVKLSSPSTRMVNNLLDIKYWTFTVLRFIWSYGGERLLYITHPIKYIRMRRWMKSKQGRRMMGEE